MYNCLKPLHICLSHSGTLKLVDKLSSDYDPNVQFWSDDLLEQLKVNIQNNFLVQIFISCV